MRLRWSSRVFAVPSIRFSTLFPVLVWIATMMGGKVPDAQAASGCQGQITPPVISVEVDAGTPRLDHTRSQGEIQEIAAQNGLVADGIGKTLGLTTSLLRSEFDLETRVWRIGDRYCSEVAALSVRVWYEDLTVFIPRSYPEDSCQFNVIYAHESEHVRIHQETLLAFRSKLHSEMEVVVRGLGATRGRTQAEVQDHPFSTVQARLARAVDKVEGIQRRKNALLDTPDSYRATSRLCGYW